MLFNQWWGGFSWIAKQIAFQVPFEQNYFWMVTLLTMVIMVVEYCFPWRTKQSFFRKDWGLDLTYLYANVFIFAVMLDGIYGLIEGLVPKDAVWTVNLFQGWGWGWQLLVFFVLQDFLQWCVHRLLHASDWLWKFHQIHHSVEEMGVAAHFRYHWMENVFYKPTTLAVLAVFAGVEPEMVILVHMGTLMVGHLNHANLNLDWGPLKYVFNSPRMHLLHHSAEHIRAGAVNFGLTLSCWDYVFGTAADSSDKGERSLGFDGMEDIPQGLIGQLLHPFGSQSSQSSPS